MFVDNTVALSNLVHGYARTTDMAAIVNAYHLLAAGLRASTYMDYVPSKANIADLPSRGDHAIPRAHGAVVQDLAVPAYDSLQRPLEAWIRDGEVYGRRKHWPV